LVVSSIAVAEIDTLVKEKPIIVVGVPAFNEEHTIASIIVEAKKYAKDVVVCDDGSTDCTLEIANGLGAQVIRHESNLGYGAALKSIILSARLLSADILITIDGDGQHDPKEIPRLIEPIINGECDVVVGSRFVDKNGVAEMPKYRQLGVKVISKLVNGSAKNGLRDAQSGFRAYNARALECLTPSEMGMGASVELLLQLKKFDLVLVEVPISCKYTDSSIVNTSTEHPLTHGIGLLMTIIKLVVEERPLVFIGIPGLICLLLGGIFGVWMLGIYSVEHVIDINISIVSLASILLGFFLLSSSITLFAITRVAEKIK
jgi:glycosyltransferase involved in cell wall biosynthesis